MSGPSVLAADIGRTTCRVALAPARGPSLAATPRIEVPSGANLADCDGVAAVLRTYDAAIGHLRRRDDDAGQVAIQGITGICLGVTGAAQHPDAATELTEAIRERHPQAVVAVVSDVVTAHFGALEGRPGVVAIAGTGAVALGIAQDGSHHLVDGWGYLLGDAGSGFAVGRAGLASALRHHDGRDGGSAQLAAAAARRYGPLDVLAATVQGDPDAVRSIAAFVPDVAAAARAGDPTAARIWQQAVTELTSTILTAAARVRDHSLHDEPVEIALCGGLFELDDLVLDPVRAAVTTRFPQAWFRAPAGDALLGALRLARGGPRGARLDRAAGARASDGHATCRTAPSTTTTRSTI